MATWEIHPAAANLDPTTQIEADSAGYVEAQQIEREDHGEP